MELIKRIFIFIFCAGFILGGFFYGSTPTKTNNSKIDSLRKIDSLAKTDTTLNIKDTTKKAK